MWWRQSVLIALQLTLLMAWAQAYRHAELPRFAKDRRRPKVIDVEIKTKPISINYLMTQFRSVKSHLDVVRMFTDSNADDLTLNHWFVQQLRHTQQSQGQMHFKWEDQVIVEKQVHTLAEDKSFVVNKEAIDVSVSGDGELARDQVTRDLDVVDSDEHVSVSEDYPRDEPSDLHIMELYEAALYHKEEAENNPQLRCKDPVPYVHFMQDQMKPLVYIPQCVLLHRCANFSGCCPHPRLECAPKKTTIIHKPFFVFNARLDNKVDFEPEFVQYIQLINHTECACRLKTDNKPLCDKKCPQGFSRINDGPRCTCDCPHLMAHEEGECERVKNGIRALQHDDLVCIKSDKCYPPKCHVDKFDVSSGFCPLSEKYLPKGMFDSLKHQRHYATYLRSTLNQVNPDQWDEKSDDSSSQNDTFEGQASEKIMTQNKNVTKPQVSNTTKTSTTSKPVVTTTTKPVVTTTTKPVVTTTTKPSHFYNFMNSGRHFMSNAFHEGFNPSGLRNQASKASKEILTTQQSVTKPPLIDNPGTSTTAHVPVKSNKRLKATRKPSLSPGIMKTGRFFMSHAFHEGFNPSRYRGRLKLVTGKSQLEAAGQLTTKTPSYSKSSKEIFDKAVTKFDTSTTSTTTSNTATTASPETNKPVDKAVFTTISSNRPASTVSPIVNGDVMSSASDNKIPQSETDVVSTQDTDSGQTKSQPFTSDETSKSPDGHIFTSTTLPQTSGISIQNTTVSTNTSDVTSQSSAQRTDIVSPTNPETSTKISDMSRRKPGTFNTEQLTSPEATIFPPSTPALSSSLTTSSYVLDRDDVLPDLINMNTIDDAASSRDEDIPEVQIERNILGLDGMYSYDPAIDGSGDGS